MSRFDPTTTQSKQQAVTPETVPSKFAKSLLRLVVQRGYDVNRVLSSADIPFNPLEPFQEEYCDEISIMQYTRLYQQVLSLLQDESFGLQPGTGVTPGAFRMMCHCIIHCENLGKAMRRACEFFRIFYEEPFHLTLREHADQALMGYPYNNVDPASHPVQAGDAYGLSAWHRFCGWLIGRSLELEEVHFLGTMPESPEKYENLFNCPIKYGQNSTVLIFQRKYLELPLIHNEQSLRDFLRTAPYQLMVLPEEGDSSSFVAQVKSLMGRDFSQGFPGFEQISGALNMSAPTLRRRLKREGTTYQQIKDGCRREAAVAYLSRPELSINAVAALMGFTDPSAFHRSFKKWTGVPPGQFRQQISSTTAALSG